MSDEVWKFSVRVRQLKCIEEGMVVMRLKYDFVIREVGGELVAVAAGSDMIRFNGMIRLNATGSYLMEKLKNEVSFEALVEDLSVKYSLDENKAIQDVRNFLNTLSIYELIDNL